MFDIELFSVKAFGKFSRIGGYDFCDAGAYHAESEYGNMYHGVVHSFVQCIEL